MRLENGMRFDCCTGLQDRSNYDGAVFDANVLTCYDRPLNSGESIRVGGRAYRYDGDDNLGNSLFTALEPFPHFESLERPHKGVFIVLEIYPLENGQFCVRPYVQSGATSSGHYARQALEYIGEFDTRETAERAGWRAGEKEIEACYA